MLLELAGRKSMCVKAEEKLAAPKQVESVGENKRIMFLSVHMPLEDNDCGYVNELSILPRHAHQLKLDATSLTSS